MTLTVVVVVLAWLVASPLLAIVVGRLLRGRATPTGPETVLDELAARRAPVPAAPSRSRAS